MDGMDQVFHEMQETVDDLVEDARARLVFILDHRGQLLASAGDTDDFNPSGPDKLGTLVPDYVPAAGGISGEAPDDEFCGVVHGTGLSVYLRIVARRLVLVMLFGRETTAGLVRLRLMQGNERLVRLIDELDREASRNSKLRPFTPISEGDLGALFF